MSKKQDELERKDRQGTQRPGSDRDDDKERADTGTPQQPPPADPPDGGGTIEGGR